MNQYIASNGRNSVQLWQCVICTRNTNFEKGKKSWNTRFNAEFPYNRIWWNVSSSTGFSQKCQLLRQIFFEKKKVLQFSSLSRTNTSMQLTRIVFNPKDFSAQNVAIFLRSNVVVILFFSCYYCFKLFCLWCYCIHTSLKKIAGQFEFIHDFGVCTRGRNVQSFEADRTLWVGSYEWFHEK